MGTRDEDWAEGIHAKTGNRHGGHEPGDENACVAALSPPTPTRMPVDDYLMPDACSRSPTLLLLVGAGLLLDVLA